MLTVTGGKHDIFGSSNLSYLVDSTANCFDALVAGASGDNRPSGSAHPCASKRLPVSWLENFFTWLGNHPEWSLPWIGYCLVMTVVSEMLERAIVWPRAPKPVLGFLYPRRLQGLIPVVLGAALGIFWNVLSNTPASSLYFASAGVASIFLFDALTAYLQNKYGVRIRLPGDDDTRVVDIIAKLEGSATVKEETYRDGSSKN